MTKFFTLFTHKQFIENEILNIADIKIKGSKKGTSRFLNDRFIYIYIYIWNSNDGQKFLQILINILVCLLFTI